VPPKTHDLNTLAKMLAAAETDWHWPEEELRFLSRAAVDFRYPGESADYPEARNAFDIAKRLCQHLLARPMD
jgi:HEPN domain-containing protein